MFGRIVRGALQIIGLLTVIGLVVAVGTFFFLAPLLQVEDRIERADYILPLAGDWHRLVRAAELFDDGIAPKVLFSRERVPPPVRIQGILADMGHPPLVPDEFLPKLLGHLGVPRTAIEPFGNGHISTVEEAEALRRHLGDRRMTIVLVTSPYHTRRASLIFKRAMPNVRWLIASTPESKLPTRWWTDREASLNVLQEVAKLAYYWAGGAFRAGEARL
jgi:uncharacterized SAM-binding protein YcdF (DUF218 family)